MPDFGDVIKSAEKTDKFLESSIKYHKSRLQEAIRTLEKNIIDMSSDFKTTDGSLLGPRVNMKQAQKIHSKLTGMFDETYGKEVREVSKGFTQSANYIKRSFKDLDVAMDFTSVDKDMIKTLKKNTWGSFQQFGLQTQQRLVDNMYSSIVGKQSFSNLVDGFSAALTGHRDKRGKSMSSYADLYAHDAIMDFHNTVHIKKAEDLGFKYFLYYGNAMGTTRDFCRQRVMKVFSKEEIESWDFKWGGKSGPAMTNRGGYNCRHHWRPVRKNWVDEDKLSDMAKEGGEELKTAEKVVVKAKKVKMTSSTQGNILDIKFKDGEQRLWKLPDRDDVTKVDAFINESLTYAESQGASTAQIKSITKKLYMKGYSLSEKRLEKKIVEKVVKKVKKKAVKGITEKVVKKVEKKILKKTIAEKTIGTASVEYELGSAYRYTSVASRVDAKTTAKLEKLTKGHIDDISKKFPRLGKSLSENGVSKWEFMAGDSFEFKIAPGKSTGMYSSDLKQIWIATNRSMIHTLELDGPKGVWTTGKNYFSTLRHETGHHYWHHCIDAESKNLFSNIYKTRGKEWFKKNVTRYGSTNTSEAFAECFSAYTSPKYGVKYRLPKEIEKVFNNAFGTKIVAKKGKKIAAKIIKGQTKKKVMFEAIEAPPKTIVLNKNNFNELKGILTRISLIADPTSVNITGNDKEGIEVVKKAIRYWMKFNLTRKVGLLTAKAKGKIFGLQNKLAMKLGSVPSETALMKYFDDFKVVVEKEIVNIEKTIPIKKLSRPPTVEKDYIRFPSGVWKIKGVEASTKISKELDNLKIPTMWTDVIVSSDPKAKIVAIGRASNGKLKYKFSEEYLAEGSRKKFDRVNSFGWDIGAIRKKTQYDIDSGDSRALLLRLEDRTGIRAGTAKDLHAKKKAYGLTTLLYEHVIVDGDKIVLDFIAKKGIPAHYEFTDKILARWLKERKARTSLGQPLFPDISANKLNKYMKQLSGKAYTIKDFRTFYGTKIAYDNLKKYMGKVLSIEEKKIIVKEVLDKASSFLHNTPNIVKSAYIDPMVWEMIGGLP